MLPGIILYLWRFRRSRAGFWALVLLCTGTIPPSLTASAWWDTQVMALKDSPKVAVVGVAECRLLDAALIRDTGGPGEAARQAVELSPERGSIQWQAKLSRSTYVLFVIARVDKANPANPSPEWPIFVRLKVSRPLPEEANTVYLSHGDHRGHRGTHRPEAVQSRRSLCPLWLQPLSERCFSLGPRGMTP
jgi:hypothetical protein